MEIILKLVPSRHSQTSRFIHYITYAAYIYPCTFTYLHLCTSYTNIWCTARLQKLISSPIQHMSLSWARQIHSTIYHLFHLPSILIIFSHLRLRLSSRLFPSDFPIKDPYACLVSPVCTTCSSHLTGYDFITLKFLESSANHVCSLCV
jgi:hypothetical protein